MPFTALALRGVWTKSEGRGIADVVATCVDHFKINVVHNSVEHLPEATDIKQFLTPQARKPIQLCMRNRIMNNT